MTFRFPSNRAASTTSFAITMTAVLLAGCAGRSLNVTPVEDWSDTRGTAAATAPVAPQALYTVQRGDTMASVATRYRTTPAILAAWNNLSPTARLTPNQVLRVSPPPSAIDGPPAATTSPIGSETVEQRPLGSSSGPSSATPSSSSNAPIKAGPSGTKRPYSDAAFAEMSRPDGGDATTATGTTTAPTAGPTGTTTATPAASIVWAWPAAGKPAQPFGDGKSKGIDLAGKAGDAVLAAADGKVTFAGTGVRGYGNFVIVRHSPDLLSVYAHNRANLVKEGATVARGQKIAEMGSDTDGVRLHFEIRNDSKPVDPLKYLPER